MSQNVIELFPPTQLPEATPHRPLYELYWTMRDGSPMCISSRDPARIVRQMESLAERKIAAKVTADGYPAGSVGVFEDGHANVLFPARST